MPDGRERTESWADCRLAVRVDGDDTRYRSIAIGHLHLPTRLDGAQMLGQLALQSGDTDALHGHI